MRYIMILTLSLLVNNVFSQENWLVSIDGCKVFNPYPRKHESVEWTGDCVDSIAQGDGQLIWYLKGKKTDNVYTGSMINGRPEGEGKYVYSFGCILEGKYRNGSIYYGTEIQVTRQDSIIYIGEFENELQNGKGVMYFPDGDWFKGQFEDNYFKDGIYTSPESGWVIESNDWTYYIPNSGKKIWENGWQYEGELKNFFPNGIGTLTYPDGEKEKGIWKKGVLKKEL